MKPLFLTSVMALSLSLSLAACQTPSPPATTSTPNTKITTSSVIPARTYPALSKHTASGSLRLQNNTLTLTLELPELHNNQDFATQKLDLSTTTKLFAQVSDSHGKTYAPTGADGDGAVNYTGGTITLTFNNLTPDELLFVDVQAKNGTTPIPQAALATVLKHTTDATPVNATLNFQTAVAAKALKALLPTHATQARSINLTALKTLTDTITGVTGNAPDLTYSQNHPSLVNTTLLATHLQSQAPNTLNAADYRQSGATVNLTVSGLAGSDKVQVQITDAASAVRTDLGNGTTSITGVTPGSGLTAIITPFGTPSQTYNYSINPTNLTLTEGNTTNLTVTATPDVSISNFSPSSGAPGTVVTLTGNGFTGTSAVQFNGVNASFTVNSDTQITATVPTNATDGVISIVNGSTINSVSEFDVAQLWYVNANASGSNNGTSWTNAFQDLQSAISASNTGDTIWVAAGTYTPHTNDRNIRFELKNGVNVYGGFNGTESTIGQRNIQANPSILSGDLNGDDNYATPGSTLSENSYQVVLANSNLTLDGFTIQGANQNSPSSADGGGLVAVNKTGLILRNLSIMNNTGTKGGVGIYLYNSPVTLEYTDFINNTTGSRGGGLYTSSSSHSTVRYCSFVNNSVGAHGAGINNSSSILTISNTYFAGNHAGNYGGGIHDDGSGITHMNHITFANNTAALSGGAYRGGDNSASFSNVLFWQSSFVSPVTLAGTGSIVALSDPFVNATSPHGPDGIPRTLDDGLNITSGASTVINQGLISGLTHDILGNPRNGNPEPGAYEFIPPPVIPDNVVLVDSDASGANNGSSWADAYTDLQTALTNAQANEEIWIAAGKYTPAAAGNTNASFQMQANVDIYGGFAGSETSKEQRIAGANTVYLSGDIDNNDTGSGSTYNRVGVNSKTIVIGANATLDGVTIQGASNNSGNGGGMKMTNTSPTLSNVTFLKNRAISGGGVGILGSATPTFNNVAFLFNGANAGGGGGGGAIYNEGTFTLNKGYFNGNIASFKGGAINNQSNSSATINDALFMSNVGQTNTANDIYNFEFTNVTVSNTAMWSSNIERSIYSLSPIQLNNITSNRTIDCPTIAHCTPKNVLVLNGGLSNATNGVDGNYLITTTVGSIDDPFLNANSPLGNDNIPFTTDDGYRLKAGAAVINQGILGGTIPGTDILGLSRVDDPEPGAYEYIP